MGILASLFLIGEGALLRFAIAARGRGFNIHSSGVILMILGGVGLVLSVVYWESWGGIGKFGRSAALAAVADGADFYRQTRVNIAGEFLTFDPEGPNAIAGVESQLTRVLPNGYCGLAPEKDCPHPQACLTCNDFETTPQFLKVHHARSETNKTLIARADADGHFRHAGNLRRIQANLERIIPSLEQGQAVPALAGEVPTLSALSP